MLIQRQMSLKKAACFAVYLILCTLAVVPAEEGERSDEMLLNRLVDSLSGDIDEDMAALLWVHCRLDLMYKEYVGDLDTFNPQKLPCHGSTMNQNCGILAKFNIQKLLHISDAQLKRGILHCLRESNIFGHVFGEEIDSKSWYTKYLESLPPQSKYPKQNSRREVIAETTVSVLDPAPVNQSPHCNPTQSPDSVSLSSHVPRRYIPESIPPPPKGKHSKSSEADSKKKKKKKNSSHISVMTAIVITAVVTFVFVSLLFLCCAKLCKTGSHSRRSDERPLLSLSLSDYSMSSSVKSFSLRNSIKGDIPRQQTINANDAQNKKQSLDDLLSLEDAAKPSSARLATFSENIQASASALNPPPGHAPIKPPPGRADPLPPEPPTFLKPSSFTANPPLAPQMPAPIGPPSSQGVRASAPPPPPPLPSGSRPPPPPPISSGAKHGAPPPPPPKGGAPPPRPPPPGPIGSKAPRPPPLGTKRQPNTPSNQGGHPGDDDDAPKAKLKPFFWDKVQANPDQAMVWNQIKAGSFQFNEEMIETLFGYAPTEKKKNEGKKESSSQEQMKYIQLIDSKKAQNLSILLRALNVTKEEVCDALQEGSELPAELLQTLLKMAPTTDEELKLRLYSGELSQLGPAERFLKALVDIPFAFKRLEALLFMCTFPEEVAIAKESFGTLEVACNELRNSRLFLKLLEAVLKTGNRMNDGTFRGGAQAFKLDTLLKLSDVKGVDGKITLLHFVVQEIIRSEGIRAARASTGSQSFSSIKSDDLLEDTSHDTEEHYRSLGLQVVSSLGSQLENVRKAAALDADNITGTVAKLGHGLVKTRNFLKNEMNNLDEESEFCNTLKSFVESSEDEVKWLLEEEKRIMALVKSTGDYFHGKAGRDEGLRIFVIVRDFLIILDKTCKEVREASARAVKSQKKEAATAQTSSESHQATATTAQDLHRRFFPAIANQRMDYSSSDDDDP